MRKFLKHIHLWLSLPAGIFIAVMCLTGAVLVFQQEIQRAVSPGFYFTDRYREVKEPLPLDALVCAAAEELSGEGRKISSVTVYSNPESTVAVGVSGQKGVYMTIDPYTGEITGKGAPAGRFFASVRSLHRWLMLTGTGRTVGRTIMGISSIMFSIILISGIFIAVPRAWRNVGQWKQALSVRRGKTSSVWWFTSHRAFGWCCAVFLLLMSLTGPMWSFSWYRNGVASIFGIENMNGGKHGNGKGTPRTPVAGQPQNTASAEYVLDGIDPGIWMKVIAGIKGLEPEAVSVSLKKETATVVTAHHHARASDTYRFDPDGNITDVQKYEDLPASRKLMGYAFLLHAGLWGGWIMKLLYFIACIGGVYLVISGYCLYVRRIKKMPQAVSTTRETPDRVTEGRRPNSRHRE